MIILQISPEFAPGTGVGGVAHALEQEWVEQGHDVRRFGLQEAGCGWLDGHRSGVAGRVQHAVRVLWFSTVGTVRARRAVRDLPPGAVSVCHNDALAGDVYVNHGVLTSAMRARGRFVWRMVRNPLHLVTAGRDRYRYAGGVHRRVVSLSGADRDTLVRSYGLAPERAVVIPNGVHTDRFRPADAQERSAARDRLGVPGTARTAVFVGHEFERKGLTLLLAAVQDLPDHHVVVVGGDPDEVEGARRRLPVATSTRVHWAGRVPDPRPFLAAADVLVLPSAYEANPLVVLEALAMGLQVVATPVGSVPEVLGDDEVSRVVPRTVRGVREGLVALATPHADAAGVRAAARERAQAQDWAVVAQSYLQLLEGLSHESADRR